MKRLVVITIVIFVLFCPYCHCSAQTVRFDREIEQLEEQAEDLSPLNIESVDDVIKNGIDAMTVLNCLGELLRRYMNTPLSVLLLITAVIILTAIGESYTYSLRYTDTKEIMSVVVSLYIVSVLILPINQLMIDLTGVIKTTAKLMQGYGVLSAGMLVFSGHVVDSAGYYAAVMGVSGALTWLSSSVLMPMLELFLSMSVSSGICSRLKLNGLIEMTGNTMKWLMTFLMTVFTAVIGLNSALSSAENSLAGRAAKFTLSSLIPLVGSSVAEAYRTVKGSVDLLRSGAGVFVILAVFIVFAPLLIRILLWSLSLGAAKVVQDAFSVSSTRYILNALSSVVSLLRAVTVSVLTALIVSAAAMLRVGGGG